MPELARYLSVLENQIVDITDKFIVDEDEQAMTQRSVNLSAQGIAYSDDQPLPTDELVELKIKLLPSGLRLVIIARVVLVETGDSPQDQGGARPARNPKTERQAKRQRHGQQIARSRGGPRLPAQCVVGDLIEGQACDPEHKTREAAVTTPEQGKPSHTQEENWGVEGLPLSLWIQSKLARFWVRQRPK